MLAASAAWDSEWPGTGGGLCPAFAPQYRGNPDGHLKSHAKHEDLSDTLCCSNEDRLGNYSAGSASIPPLGEIRLLLGPLSSAPRAIALMQRGAR